MENNKKKAASQEKGLESRVDELTKLVEALTVQNAQQQKAINNPVSFQKDGPSTEQLYTGFDKLGSEFALPDHLGNIDRVRNSRNGPAVMKFESKAERLKFDKEFIKILVNPPSQPFEPMIDVLSINGRKFFIKRGEPQWVPRCFVEMMMYCRRSTFGNVKGRNANGDETFSHPETRSSRFPCQIVEDRNPRGKEWLTLVTNTAA